MSGKHSAYDFNDFKAKAEVCIWPVQFIVKSDHDSDALAYAC